MYFITASIGQMPILTCILFHKHIHWGVFRGGGGRGGQKFEKKGGERGLIYENFVKEKTRGKNVTTFPNLENFYNKCGGGAFEMYLPLPPPKLDF